ncbi:MAG: phosphate ABC transporter substrate-binding protein PstS [Elainellaceae cyanobacterium]
MSRPQPRLRSICLLGIALAFGAACQPQPPSDAPSGISSGGEGESPQETVLINGTGATFPVFIYQKWFSEYNQLHPNVQVNYQPVGSAAGIQQMISETVDFGASDIAMTDEEMAQTGRGVVLIPMTAGSVAIAYNLPGAEGLRLSREALTQIFLGQITQWNDPLLVDLNPDLALPDLPISLVHRSDGSGTTAVLTAHLNAISPEWAEQVGTGLSVAWPAGIGIKSNAGVSAQIQQAEGTLGYVEYSFAQQLGLATAALENRAGEFVQPTLAATAAALAAVELPENLRGFVTDPDAPEAYPIVTYSWLLAYESYPNEATAIALRDVVQWSLREGQAFSEDLGYVPLPESVVERAIAASERIDSD